jgi:hypothetical protein
MLTHLTCKIRGLQIMLKYTDFEPTSPVRFAHRWVWDSISSLFIFNVYGSVQPIAKPYK